MFIKLLSMTYIEFCASFQDSFFDGFNLVAGQVQDSQIGKCLEFNRGEDWIERVA